MKRGAGKRKGTAFEWKMAKVLSKWATAGVDSTQLIPSTLSGGWRRGLQVNKRHGGDLTANGEVGEWLRQHVQIECKHHRKIDPWCYWTQSHKQDNLWRWWREAQESCAGSSVVPLLLIRANFRPVMAGLPVPVLRELSLDRWLTYVPEDLGLVTLNDLLLHGLPGEVCRIIRSCYPDGYSMDPRS